MVKNIILNNNYLVLTSNSCQITCSFSQQRWGWPITVVCDNTKALHRYCRSDYSCISHVFRINGFRQSSSVQTSNKTNGILCHMDFVSWHCVCVYSVPTDMFPLISLLWHIQGMLGCFGPSCCPLAEWEDWFHHQSASTRTATGYQIE